MAQRKPKQQSLQLSKAFDLVEEFGELKGIVRSGFLGVNGRLDKLNGSVARHELEIDKLRNDESYQAGRRKASWAFWAIFGSVVTIIVAILTFFATAGYIHP